MDKDEMLRALKVTAGQIAVIEPLWHALMHARIAELLPKFAEIVMPWENVFIKKSRPGCKPSDIAVYQYKLPQVKKASLTDLGYNPKTVLSTLQELMTVLRALHDMLKSGVESAPIFSLAGFKNLRYFRQALNIASTLDAIFINVHANTARFVTMTTKLPIA
jgi:hypothetical protein